MVSKQENRTYYIERGRLTFVENDLSSPNRIAVSVSSGTTIQVYDDSLIGFMSDGKFYSWMLKGYSTKLSKNEAHYIYARLSKTSTDALVIFSVNQYKLDGSLANAEEGEENPPSEQYYYVRIGEVTATDGTSKRELTYDSGILGTTKDVYENAGSAQLNEMFSLNKTVTPWYIMVKHAIYDLTIKRAVNLIGSLIWGDKELTGVHSEEDAYADSAPDDRHLATSGYVRQASDKRHLRKDQDDRTEHSLGVGGDLDVDKAARVNKVQSPEFTRGLLGSGFMIDYDEKTGKWRMELDQLTVRQLIYIYEMAIHRMSHVGGSIVLSPASMECIRVEERSDAWRCYFKNSNGNKTIWNEFVPGDLARCQSVNLASDRLDDFGNPTNFYWRLVTAVGDDWIDLSKSDFLDGSGAPEAGDEIVHLGNKTNKRRQGAIVLDSSGPDAPSIKQYRGINSYSLEGKEITVFSESINKIRGRFISEVTGEDMDATLETWRKQMESVKEQTDRTMMIWFYDHAPSADNLPESEWNDLNTKAEHVEDIFYCRPSGKAYRYMYVEETYQWKEITDQDTLRALELAGKAQSSADSKIRNFTAQPTDEDAYDVGDVWSNATYPADGSTYKNDMLRCVTAKIAGEPFDIAHWQPVNEATTAKIETFVEYDKATGKVKSKIKLSSDEINLEGYTTINGGFAVDTNGNVSMVGANINEAIINLANITNANVSGVITCNKLLRKVLAQGDITNGSVAVLGGGQYILPELEYGQCVEVKLFHIMINRALIITYLECANSNVKIFSGNNILDAKYGRASLQKDVELVGFRYESDHLLSGYTYWKIIPYGDVNATTEDFVTAL